MKEPYYNNITGVMTIPEYVGQNGSLTTDADEPKIVRGAGTDLSTIEEGDFIFANNEIRRVNFNHYRYNTMKDNGDGTFGGFQGEQMLTLNAAFSVALAVDTFAVVKPSIYRSVDILNNGGADGYYNGKVLKDGVSVELGPDLRGLTPIVIDGTGTNIAVSAQPL